MTAKLRIPTGIEQIDRPLGGGIEPGRRIAVIGLAERLEIYTRMNGIETAIAPAPDADVLILATPTRLEYLRNRQTGIRPVYPMPDDPRLRRLL